MKKIICLVVVECFLLMTGYAQKSVRETFFDFVLSDTSGEDKRELLIKFNVLDKDNKKMVCITYNDSLYANLKRKYRYDFKHYKALMRKILQGDTLLPYTYLGDYLANDIVNYMNPELDSVWQKGVDTFLNKYTCNNQIHGAEPWNLMYYLFDVDITNDFSGGGYGRLVYFNPVIKRRMSENRKRDLKKMYLNEDGSVRGTCGEVSFRKQKEREPIVRYMRCDDVGPLVKVYIVGLKNDSVSVKTIHNGFTLNLSDTSYTILGFHVLNLGQRDYLMEVDFNGNTASFQDANSSLRENTSLYIENIRATKDGKCYTVGGVEYRLTK
jgi:hypothetical protein